MYHEILQEAGYLPEVCCCLWWSKENAWKVQILGGITSLLPEVPINSIKVEGPGQMVRYKANQAAVFPSLQ